jgi:class 3 adenylate cyclase
MVSTPLKTTNNEWVMTVAYENEEYPTWKVWSIVATVVGSFLISTLYFTIMIQKVSFENVKKKYREDITQPPKLRLRSFLEETTTRTTNSETSADVQQVVNAAPVADLFPATTVLFSDVVGFSAWSSEREPTQVFTLLQTLFHAFDKVGKKHDVFNVHTTFHCYVGVTGFPIPQPDHALRMVKFARECMVLATKLTQSLEKSLGPGTGDLCVRFGLHSGPVTAGVMYGDRARLQLFGDTMSTGARILSSGEGGRIHLSQATADLIAESGKRRCLETRQGMVSITGNGDEVQTYWLKDRHISAERFNGISSASRSVCRDALESSSLSACSDCDSDLWGDEELGAFREADHVDGEKRLIEWHVDWMARLLKDIIARRNKRKAKHTTKQSGAKVFCPSDSQIQHGETPLDEVLEVIILPAFDPSSVPTNSEIEAVEIREEVISQLRELVTEISKLYRGNPFHNFEHASHVTMSVHKLLHRIVVPDQVAYDRRSAKTVAADLHDYTFGITSDPLTHFAVVFSALVHDVDHTGLTNGQLANENPDLAGTYKNKSIAEQNSVDIAWERLMVPRFKDLQDCLFGDESELLRFRQIIVNVVLATDIFDKELKALRNLRWDKAFHPEKYAEESCLDLSENSSVLSPSSRPSRRQSLTTTTDRENLREKHLEISLKLRGTNRRATIVIEHIIQASDVSHTMQHWHIYTKWNELLFQEMFAAWKTGRSDKDPSEGWYKGEIWFFDNYVIPLAKKLAECGVFGVASDECLHNALENRKEWAVKGGQIVADMSERANNTLLGWERKISSRELVIPMVAEEEDFDDLSDEEVVS